MNSSENLILQRQATTIEEKIVPTAEPRTEIKYKPKKESRIELMVVDPCQLHVYYEFGEKTLKKLESLEVKRILGIYPKMSGEVYEAYLDSKDLSWYFHNVKPDTIYCAKLNIPGIISLRSKSVRTPRNKVSEY